MARRESDLQLLADELGGLKSIHDGHLKVHQYEIKRIRRFQQLHCLLPIGGDGDIDTGSFLPGAWMIFDAAVWGAGA